MGFFGGKFERKEEREGGKRKEGEKKSNKARNKETRERKITR